MPKTPAPAATLVEELGMLIAKTRRLAWNRATHNLERLGESMLAFQVLGRLVRHGRQTQTELAQALAQHPTGISRLLEELDRGGRVVRRRDPEDRRRVHVEASTAGRRHFRRILPDVLRGVAEALEPLSEGERRALRDLLSKVVSQDLECAPEGMAEQAPRRAAPPGSRGQPPRARRRAPAA